MVLNEFTGSEFEYLALKIRHVWSAKINNTLPVTCSVAGVQ